MIRLAVIGGGPKSLFALLALHERLTVAAAKHITVEVFDPLPPGSGSVWRREQAEVLRLNVNMGIVDASSSLSSENFSAWVTRVAPEWSGEKYPPRVLVGQYLREQFRLLARHGNMKVVHAPFAVTGVERRGSQWQVRGSFGERHYDEVLLATGHGLADAVPAEPLPGTVNQHALIGDYSALTQEDIPAESTVWIRGAALTAYDVALLLTEGRGGSWQPPGGDCRGGAGLHYVASGREPRRMIFSSRSGSLMYPKSEAVPEQISACVEQHKLRLREWGRQVREVVPDGGVGLAGMWTVLLQCALQCAQLMGSTETALSLWRTATTGRATDPRIDAGTLPRPVTASDHLRHSLAVNRMASPVTTAWLWARVWSGLYAEVVLVMDRLPRSTRAWTQFVRIAGNLERFAFGPPELTARKLVALFDTGMLHLATPGESPPREAVLVDAVTPGPGSLHRAAPGGHPNSDVVSALLQDGQVSIRAGDRGLLTEPDGTALASDGSRNESLAALGRPTEDPTLGHDTLNRALHGEYTLWARRVADLAIDQSTRLIGSTDE
ncbi:FAD/NAD(P)-binding protein [Arthrobacter sp. TMN-49]